MTRHAAVVLAAFVASFAGAAAVAAEPGEVPLAVARGERAALLAAPIPTAADGTTGDAHSETERRLTYERMRAAYSEAITHTPLPAKRDVWVELAEAELEVAARELRIADEHLAPDEASRPSRGQLGLAIEDHHRAAVASLATCREAGACDGTEAAAAIAFFYDRILRRPQSDRPTDRSVTPTPLPAIRLFADAGGRRLIGTVAGSVKGALDEPARRGAQAIVVEILAGPESDPLFIAREDASQLADTPPAAERGPSPGGFAPANEALPLRLSPRGPVVACTASAAWIRVVERTDELARIELEGVRAASRDGLFVVRLADLTYDWRAPWACRRAKQK